MDSRTVAMVHPAYVLLIEQLSAEATPATSTQRPGLLSASSALKIAIKGKNGHGARVGQALSNALGWRPSR